MGPLVPKLIEDIMCVISYTCCFRAMMCEIVRQHKRLLVGGFAKFMLCVYLLGTVEL